MSSANETPQVDGDHYRRVPGEQHWDYTWRHGFDQFQYNITRYIERWRDKFGLKDLYKARHNLQKYIELIEAGNDPFMREGSYGPPVRASDVSDAAQWAAGASPMEREIVAGFETTGFAQTVGEPGVRRVTDEERRTREAARVLEENGMRWHPLR